MKNASGVEQSDEARASNSGAAPLARVQAACECPARKALELFQAWVNHSATCTNTPCVENWRIMNSPRSAFLGPAFQALQPALAAPCHCEGLRNEFREAAAQAERSRQFTVAAQKQTHLIAAERDEQAAADEAEIQELRAQLNEALDILKPFAEGWASRPPSFDDRRLFSIICVPEERLVFERIVALLAKNASPRASGEPARMEARASQDCPIPKEIL